MTFEENHFTYPIKPIIIEISHCFQLSLTVEVNFPTNSTMITYKNTREKKIIILMFMDSTKKAQNLGH
jgi:hypothetical protein